MAIVGLGGEKLWLCPSLNDNPHDISGNGNNGTYNGGMGTVADVSKGGKRAYSFDGVDDYIDLTTSNVASSQNLNSFSLWINPDSINSVAVIINAGNASNGDRFINLGINGTQNILCGRSNDWLVAGNHSASNWYHLCVISNGTTISLYKDGLLIGSRTDATVNFTETKCRIGGFILNTSNQYDGLMDDIRIFDRALTTAEIKHLAKARGITGTPLKKGLGDEKLWLCPSIDDSAEDLSGNGNNGTYNGGMGTVSLSGSGGSKAYDFDGLDDYIDCGSASAIHSNSVFTYSIWIKASSNTGTTVGVFGAYDHTTGDRGALFAVGNNFSNKGAFYYQSVGSTYNSNELLQSTVNVVDGTWHHIVCVFDGVNGRALFYRDGTLVGNTASNVPSTVNQSTDFLVGRGAAANFSGYVDDARIFDRELTPTEITHLASARGVAGSPYGFKGLGGEKLWLCPTLDDSAEDISGNRNHGTYNGGMGTVADTSNGGTRAYNFEGSAKRIDLPNSLQSAFFGNHSFAAWIRIESDLYNADPKVTILGMTTNSGRWVHFIYDKQTNSGNGGLEMCADDGTYNGCVGDTGTDFWMETDQWFHVAGVRDYSSSQVKLFVNGSLLHTGSFTASAMSAMDQGLHIGWSGLHGYAGNTSSGSHAYIRYDDIRVFDRALTQEEVTHLAKSRGVLGSPHNLNGIVHLLSSFIHPFT